MDDYVQESERVGNGRETCVAIVDNYRKSRKNKMSEGMTDNNKKCQRENLMALFGVIPDPQDKPHLFCDVCGIKCIVILCTFNFEKHLRCLNTLSNT